jgi:alpha-mannosidase
MNNYWDTNWRAGQGGHFSFHYVVTSAASTDAADLSRLGWEEITPLEADIITTQDKALGVAAPNQAGAAAEAKSPPGLGGKQGSFLEVEDPNVVLETWKPAEDGNGTILRFLDFGGTERTVTVRTPSLHLGQVSQTDAVERGQTAVSMSGDNQFNFTIHPHEIVTIRIVERQK